MANSVGFAFFKHKGYMTGNIHVNGKYVPGLHASGTKRGEIINKLIQKQAAAEADQPFMASKPTMD